LIFETTAVEEEIKDRIAQETYRAGKSSIGRCLTESR
jgi:hypothetical protein